MAYSGGMMNEEQHTILKTLMEQSHDEVEYLFIPFFGEVSIPLPNSEIQLNPIAAVVSYGGAKSTVHFIVPGISLLAPPVLTYPNESVQLVLTDLPIVL